MASTPRLVERHKGLSFLAIPNRPTVPSIGVGAAVTATAAWAGTTNLFSLRRGRSFRSPSVARKRWGFYQESRKGLTFVSYDLNDYASATVPGDGAISFVRIEEFDGSGASMGEGPILVVPPPAFFATGRRNLVINGTAPTVASVGNNLPPPGAIPLALPKFADELTISNVDVNNALYVSFGAGLQEVSLAPQGAPGAVALQRSSTQVFTEAGADHIYLRAEDGGGVAFSVTAAIVNGLQA